MSPFDGPDYALSVPLPEDEWERLQAFAEREGLTVDEAAMWLVQDQLDRQAGRPTTPPEWPDGEDAA